MIITSTLYTKFQKHLILKKNFIKYIDSFKGLEHRHEIF